MLNVVFDLGGVLLTWDPSAIVASVFDDASDQAIVLDGVFAHEDWVELDRGVLSPAEAVQRAAARTGIPAVRLTHLFHAIPHALVPVPAVVELVMEVRHAGHPVYALSNLHRASLERQRDAFDILDLFDGRVVSCEVGACKPEPAIFRRLLEGFALDPTATVFIDDMQPNLDAAAAFGVRTVLYTGVDSCRGELQALGVHLA